MSLQTKITLSVKELELVQNESWILTKRSIIDKVFHLMNDSIKEIDINFRIDQQIPTQPPKIYKGESYLNLPYVTLDYPRWFKNEDIFALRTMFWWGNFISVTLHVAGNYKSLFDTGILNKCRSVSGLFVCIHEEQWHHHFNNDNYIPVTSLNDQDLANLRNRNFLKVALKFDLNKFNEMPHLLRDAYKEIGELIT